MNSSVSPRKHVLTSQDHPMMQSQRVSVMTQHQQQQQQHHHQMQMQQDDGEKVGGQRHQFRMCSHGCQRFYIPILISIGMIVVIGMRSEMVAILKNLNNASFHNDPSRLFKANEANKQNFRPDETAVQLPWTKNFIADVVENCILFGIVLSAPVAGYLTLKYDASILLGISVALTSSLNLCLPVLDTFSYRTSSLTSFIARISLLIVVRLLQGISEGIFVPASYALLINWAPRHELSTIICLSIVGVSVGPLIGMPITLIIERTWGYAIVFFIYSNAGFIWVAHWFRSVDPDPCDSLHTCNPKERRLILASVVRPTHQGQQSHPSHPDHQFQEGHLPQTSWLSLAESGHGKAAYSTSQSGPSADVVAAGGLAWYASSTSSNELGGGGVARDTHHVTHCSAAPRSIPWKQLMRNKTVISILICNMADDWNFQIASACMKPYFMKNFSMNIDDTVNLLTIPFLARSVTVFIGGLLTDVIVSRTRFKVETVRKFWSSVGFGLKGLFFITLGFTQRISQATIILTLCLGFSGFAVTGYAMNAVEIAPSFAGFIMGLASSASTLAGIITVYIASLLVTHFPNYGWLIAFISAGALQILVALIYNFTASSRLQSWGFAK